MTHKQRCEAITMQYLTDLSLAEIFDQSIFNYCYNKSKSGGGNPCIIGLNAADMIIQTVKPFKHIYHESGNEE